MAGMKSLHLLLTGEKFPSEICDFWMVLSFCHQMAFFKGVSAREEIRQRYKTLHLRHLISHSAVKSHCQAPNLPYNVEIVTTLPPLPLPSRLSSTTGTKMNSCMGGVFYFISFLLWAPFPYRYSPLLLFVSFLESWVLWFVPGENWEWGISMSPFIVKNPQLCFSCHSSSSPGNFTLAPCPPTSIEWNGSNCSTIRINIQAIMLAKGAANHIYVDCQIHYYKQMAVLALQCSWEKTDIISN